MTEIALLLVGVVVGVLCGAGWVRARASVELAEARAGLAAARSELDVLARQATDLPSHFKAAASDALRANSEQLTALADQRLAVREQAVAHLVAPVREALARVQQQVETLTRERTAGDAALRKEVEMIRGVSESLRQETSQLVGALRRPEVRGGWGELQLKRLVEVAGMMEHCDFETQVSVRTDDGMRRPDMVVRLAGGKHVVVDSKVSLDAYLSAMATGDEGERQRLLTAHARQVRSHVDALASKEYWRQFTPSPEFVVMFVPQESFLSIALEHDPALFEHAARSNVVLASPTVLLTVLRTVAYSWTSEALSAEAQQVLDLGKELYNRLAVLGDKFDRLGRSLTSSVNAYNETVGSLESRVLVSARRMHQMRLTDQELAPRGSLELVVKQPSSPEMLESRDMATVRDLPQSVEIGVVRPRKGAAS